MGRKANRTRVWRNQIDVAWYEAHPTGKKPTVLPDSELLLRVSNEYFTAGAIWRRKSGQWQCVKAAPIIKWMAGAVDRGAVKLDLIRRGCSWEWLSPGDNASQASWPRANLDSSSEATRDDVKQTCDHTNPAAHVGSEALIGGRKRGDGGSAGNCGPLTASSVVCLSLQTASSTTRPHGLSLDGGTDSRWTKDDSMPGRRNKLPLTATAIGE